MRTRAEQETQKNLFRAANDMMAKSKRQTPLKFGPLRGSGFVVKQGDSVVAGYNKSYALAVHEIPPPGEAPSPRQWRPGSRTARHRPPTKWKFLQDPAEAEFGNIAQQFSGNHSILRGLFR